MYMGRCILQAVGRVQLGGLFVLFEQQDIDGLDFSCEP